MSVGERTGLFSGGVSCLSHIGVSLKKETPRHWGGGLSGVLLMVVRIHSYPSIETMNSFFHKGFPNPP